MPAFVSRLHHFASRAIIGGYGRDANNLAWPKQVRIPKTNFPSKNVPLPAASPLPGKVTVPMSAHANRNWRASAPRIPAPRALPAALELPPPPTVPARLSRLDPVVWPASTVTLPKALPVPAPLPVPKPVDTLAGPVIPPGPKF